MKDFKIPIIIAGIVLLAVFAGMGAIARSAKLSAEAENQELKAKLEQAQKIIQAIPAQSTPQVNEQTVLQKERKIALDAQVADYMIVMQEHVPVVQFKYKTVQEILEKNSTQEKLVKQVIDELKREFVKTQPVPQPIILGPFEPTFFEEKKTPKKPDNQTFRPENFPIPEPKPQNTKSSLLDPENK